MDGRRRRRCDDDDEQRQVLLSYKVRATPHTCAFSDNMPSGEREKGERGERSWLARASQLPILNTPPHVCTHACSRMSMQQCACDPSRFALLSPPLLFFDLHLACSSVDFVLLIFLLLYMLLLLLFSCCTSSCCRTCASLVVALLLLVVVVVVVVVVARTL